MSPADFLELQGYMQEIASRKTWEEQMAAASCVGKHPFESFGEAQMAIANMRRRHRDSATASVYHCGRCEKWHLGRSNR